MRKSLILFISLLSTSGFIGNSFAQKPAVKFDLRDFYFYDENRVMKRLDLAPKIVVKFLKSVPEAEQGQFLEKFSPVAQKKDAKDSSAVIIEFSSSITPYQIVEKLNEIADSNIAEPAPVVYVDNIEAVTDGIVIEPKTLLSAEAIEKRLKRFGDFEVSQSKPEQSAWVLFLAEIKPPLHTLLLVNLVNKDSWVKRAYPHFRYLHDPIVGTLEIEPVSGTVDEARTIKFSIKVFDPAIKVREDLLPNFGEGKFVPMSGNSAPQAMFFFLDGDRGRNEFLGARSRAIVFSWKFRNYAVGEWVISGQPVQYEKNGVLSTLTSPQASMVVTSLIGNLAIDDLPSPKPLILSVRKDNSKPPSLSFQAPTLWFERWVAAETATHYSFLAAVYFSGAAIILCLIMAAPRVAKSVRERRQKNQFLNDIKKSCNEVVVDVSLESYRRLRDITKRIEKKLDEKSDLNDETRQSLSSIRRSLDVMYAPDFSPESQEVKDISDRILALLEKGGQK